MPCLILFVAKTLPSVSETTFSRLKAHKNRVWIKFNFGP